ncbi:MAG: hypothetical protein V4750_06065 [Pseudomonadota bacterium]
MSSAVLGLSVIDLAQDHTEKFAHQREQIVGRKRAARALLSLVPSMVGKFLCRRVEGYSRSMADQAVWFRGARAAVADAVSESLPLDPEMFLVEKLERMEADLLSLRAGALETASKLQELDGKSRGGLRDECRHFAATAAQLFEAVRDFRLELLEHDADRSAREDGYLADSPQELDALLTRIFND